MSYMLVCPEPLAAKVGQDIFAQGGNAVDAAVAAAFAQGVTNPLLCGLGGTGLMYYYDAKKRKGTVLDFEVTVGSKAVPASWEKEFVGRAETVGRYILKSEANQIGHQSIMTPGFVRGLWSAYQRFGSGRVPWKELLAPAAKLAKDGFQIYPYIGGFWQNRDDRPGYPSLMRKLGATPDAKRVYLRSDGSRFEEGYWLVQADYGRTLQRLADAGGEDFYTGEIARAIAKDFAAHDALMTADDLKNFPVGEEQPISGRFRGFQITSTPVSSSGGHFLEILQILERFDLKKLRHNSPKYVDTFARILRATFADNVKLKCMDIEQAAPLEMKNISPPRRILGEAN
jgi:gamma-glutamyltranspeptidase/glutathione hydrolase